MLLNVYHDKPSSLSSFEQFLAQNILEKLKAIDSRARRKGLGSLEPARNPLIAIGMESDGKGRVTKNSYGVFNLSWQSESHPEWAQAIRKETEEIRRAIRKTHGAPLRYLIWAGMGGSAEDKNMYNAVGLLRRGPRCYVLDSTDPAKLKHILADIERRSRQNLSTALKSTLVVGMAMGMTSYEPVVNLQKLAALYEKNRIDGRVNFLYMTLPGSILDQFGSRQGYRRVELQPDGANGTAGRHSAPLTRGSLYPLALASADLSEWLASAQLGTSDIHAAWKLAAFLHTQSKAGRDKVTLLLPKQWAGAGLWTKQDFEESLGKSEKFGLKIVINDRGKLANYLAPKDPGQDRCFLAVQVKGIPHTSAAKIAVLRRAGYPLAVLKLDSPELSRYMQFIHYAVFGVAWLERMNFVTQPSVELYKAITAKLHDEAQKAGGIEHTREWTRTQDSGRRARWRAAATLCYDRLPETLAISDGSAAKIYASILRTLSGRRAIEYAELTFFGDTRYSPEGRAMLKCLERAAERVFCSVLHMPADVYEGPAMNHSYHEMIIGHGRCLSTVLLSEKAEKIPAADYTADYHRAQFLATQMALAERGRHVVSLTVKDLESGTLAALDEFFRQVAHELKSRR